MGVKICEHLQLLQCYTSFHSNYLKTVSDVCFGGFLPPKSQAWLHYWSRYSSTGDMTCFTSLSPKSATVLVKTTRSVIICLVTFLMTQWQSVWIMVFVRPSRRHSWTWIESHWRMTQALPLKSPETSSLNRLFLCPQWKWNRVGKALFGKDVSTAIKWINRGATARAREGE